MQISSMNSVSIILLHSFCDTFNGSLYSECSSKTVDAKYLRCVFHLFLAVCEKVESKGRTTYNEVSTFSFYYPVFSSWYSNHAF